MKKATQETITQETITQETGNIAVFHLVVGESYETARKFKYFCFK